VFHALLMAVVCAWSIVMCASTSWKAEGRFSLLAEIFSKCVNLNVYG
jgi:hypothetical protein